MFLLFDLFPSFWLSVEALRFVATGLRVTSAETSSILVIWGPITIVVYKFILSHKSNLAVIFCHTFETFEISDLATSNWVWEWGGVAPGCTGSREPPVGLGQGGYWLFLGKVRLGKFLFNYNYLMSQIHPTNLQVCLIGPMCFDSCYKFSCLLNQTHVWLIYSTASKFVESVNGSRIHTTNLQVCWIGSMCVSNSSGAMQSVRDLKTWNVFA